MSRKPQGKHHLSALWTWHSVRVNSVSGRCTFRLNLTPAHPFYRYHLFMSCLGRR